MFAVTVEDPEMEPEPQIELKIHPSLLLKVRYFYGANWVLLIRTKLQTKLILLVL